MDIEHYSLSGYSELPFWTSLQTKSESVDSHFLVSLNSWLSGIVFSGELRSGKRLISYVSLGCFELTGYTVNTLKTLQGFDYHDIVHREDLVSLKDGIDKSLLTGKNYKVKYRILTKDGQQKWVLEKGQAFKTLQQEEISLHGFIIDISNVKENSDFDEDLKINDISQFFKQTELKYISIFENITQGIFQMSADGEYLFANKAFKDIFACQSLLTLSHCNNAIPEKIYVDPNSRKELNQLIETQGYVFNFEAQIYRFDGNVAWISQNIKEIHDSKGNFLYYEGTVEDISERRKLEEDLIYQAHNDALTGLTNRLWVIGKLSQIIANAKNTSHYQYALLFLDLDGFKLINDSLGHAIGDKLLIQVSQRINNLLKEQVSLSRLSGDEFVIVIENFQKIEEILELVNSLQKMFQLSFSLANEKIFVNCSIGIALGKKEYFAPDQIIRDADVAMYQAKSKGKGTYAFFSPVVQDALLSRLQMENDLYGALERNEFTLHYQPIYILSSGRMIGFEALLRWDHPTKGLISPAHFIPIIEEMGLIRAIGLWSFREACRQMKQWKDKFGNINSLTMSVNLSIYQFKQADLLEQISAILQEFDLDGRYLKVELTESAIMESIGSEITIMQGLKDLGIRLCIDDFGTGYSSLSRLHDLPIDTVKIDQSFIKFMDINDNIIVSTIITLAHALNMSVVAEGIENIEQLKKLTGMRCEMGQGYLFSRPIETQVATRLVALNSSLKFNQEEINDQTLTLPKLS